MRRFVLLVLIFTIVFIQSLAFGDTYAEESPIIQHEDNANINSSEKKLFKKSDKKLNDIQSEEIISEDKEEEEIEVLHGFVEYYPDGTIFFDEIKESEGIFLKIKQPTTYNQYSVLDIKGVNYEEIKNRQKGIKRHVSNEYQIADFYTDYTEKIGNFSYGTSYSADIDTGEFEYNTKFFARYDSKHYALQVAYGKNAYTSTGNQSDFVYLTPEWKIGKGFVLKDTFKANTLGLKQGNEIMLKYTPQFIKDNPLDIELGVGQSYYQYGSQNSVFKFATTLRL